MKAGVVIVFVLLLAIAVGQGMLLQHYRTKARDLEQQLRELDRQVDDLSNTLGAWSGGKAGRHG